MCPCSMSPQVLDFLKSVIDSLAWPTTVLVLALIFRSQIERIVRTVAHLKYKDIEVDFREEIDAFIQAAKDSEVVEQKQSLRPSETKPNAIKSTLRDEINSVIDNSPQAAVLLGWTLVESELLTLIQRTGVSPDYPPHNSAVQNIEFLRNAKIFGPKMVLALENARRIRNRVAHLPSNERIDSDLARQYVTVIYDIVDLISALPGPKKEPTP
jgi:hypothetical protein